MITDTISSLSSLSFSNIFVFLFYGVIAGWGTGYLQVSEMSPALSRTLLWATAVNGLISMCVLIINNLRDIDSDRAAGKRTFPVRFGKRAGEIGMAVIVLLMPLCAWVAFNSWISVAVFIPAFCLLMFTLCAKGAQYNLCLLCAGLVNLCYVGLAALSVAL